MSNDTILSYIAEKEQEDDEICFILQIETVGFHVFFDDFKIRFYSLEDQNDFLKIRNSVKYSLKAIIYRLMLCILLSLICISPRFSESSVC
jgi:hypothetical protein